MSSRSWHAHLRLARARNGELLVSSRQDDMIRLPRARLPRVEPETSAAR